MDPADDRPLGSYTAIMGAFGAAFGGALIASRNRLPGPSEVSEEVAGSGPLASSPRCSARSPAPTSSSSPT